MFNMNYFLISGIAIIIGLQLYWQYKCLKQKKRDIFLETLINNLPVGIYSKDLNGNITFANEEFAKMMNLTLNKLKYKKIYDIFPQSDIEKILKEDENILKTKTTITVEKSLIKTGNETHIYQIIKTPIFDKKNNISGFITLLQNIDKEKSLEKNKQSFVATLTHDLKTPTNAQLNILNLLLTGRFGKLNSEQFEMLTLTHNSCKYMSDLIGTIMDTYNNDNGSIKLQLEQFDIISVIKEICTDTQALKKQNNLTVQFESNYNKYDILADKLQIKRVIVNFLSNAIAYSYPNSTIYIHVEKENNYLNLYIKNKSKQIPENELKTIFDKYKKTKFAHFNKTATGLGLYLSKQVITLHKGEIYAKSYDDNTCIFGFKIPTNTSVNQAQLTNVS